MAININDQLDQISTTRGILTQTDIGGLIVASGPDIGKPAAITNTGLIRYNNVTNVFEVVIAGVYYTLAAVPSGQSPFLTGFLPITGSAPMTGTLGIVAGSSSSPGLYIANNGSIGTGLFSSSTNTLGLSTSGNSALFIDATGHVCIGTTIPASWVVPNLGTPSFTQTASLTVVQAGSGQAYFGSTGASQSAIVVDTATAGLNSVLYFADAGVAKWATFKEGTTGNYVIYDQPDNKVFLRAVQGGALTLGPAQNVYIDQSGNLFTPGSSLAQNGYEKLQNGLIMQWGYVTIPGSGSLTVTFPMTFPHACFNFIISSNTVLQYVWGGYISTSQALVDNNNGSVNCLAFWQAIGY